MLCVKKGSLWIEFANFKMACNSEAKNLYSVGQVSQLLSTSRKRKKNSEENNSLKSLFSMNSREQPMFIQLKEEKAKRTSGMDYQKEERSKCKKKKLDITLNKSNIASNDNQKKIPPHKSKEDSERLQRTVFVGNVPVTLKKKALKKLFEEYGKVESVRFRSVALAKPSMSRTVGMKKKEYHKDTQTLNGYIVFQDQSSACDALQSNGHEIEGRHIRVDIACNDKVHNHARSIFVGNLPFDTDEEPLRELFKGCGEIESVRLIRDNKTNIGKGFGFILFKSKDAVGFAMKLNQIHFKGRPIRVFPSSEHPKKGHYTKSKKGKLPAQSFSGLQVKKSQRMNKPYHIKRKENIGKKKGPKKRAGKNTGKPSDRSVAYKQRLNKKMKAIKQQNAHPILLYPSSFNP